MSLKITNDGNTGSVELVCENTAGNSQVVIPKSGVMSADTLTGKVLQVATAIKTDGMATSATSYTSASHSIAFTPLKADSTIIISISSGKATTNASTREMYVTVFQDSTNLSNTTDQCFSLHRVDANNGFFPHSTTAVVAAGDTTARTYAAYIKAAGGTVEYNRSGGVVVMTIMEIGA